MINITDQNRNPYILSKPLSKYGRGNKDIESALSGCQIRQTQEAKGCFRSEILGSVAREDSRYRRRISESCLQSTCDALQAGCDA